MQLVSVLYNTVWQERRIQIRHFHRLPRAAGMQGGGLGRDTALPLCLRRRRRSIGSRGGFARVGTAFRPM